jgi:hypothetical protein
MTRLPDEIETALTGIAAMLRTAVEQAYFAGLREGRSTSADLRREIVQIVGDALKQPENEIVITGAAPAVDVASVLRTMRKLDAEEEEDTSIRIPDKVPAASLAPITPKQNAAFAALRTLVEVGCYSTRELLELGGPSAPAYLPVLAERGYIFNAGMRGAPDWHILAIGEPIVEESVKATWRDRNAPDNRPRTSSQAKASKDEAGEALRRTPDRLASRESGGSGSVVAAHDKGDYSPVRGTNFAETVKRPAPARPQISEAAVKLAEMRREEPAPTSPVPDDAALRVEVGKYLREKGVTVKALKGGLFDARGRELTFSELLDLANELRDEDQLQPFKVEQVA